MLVARISLTFSRHSSLSFIALGRSSGQHPVSSHSCWMYVRAVRPPFARPCVGIEFKIYFAATGSGWLRVRGLEWRLSQPGFDPSYGKLVCLASLMSSERNRSVCGWLYRYIYSPTLVRLNSLANEVIVLPLAFIASLFIYELRSR